MAIAFVAQSTARATGDPASITLPAGISAGHIILLFITTDANGGDTISPPSGFTELLETAPAGGFPRCAVARKVAAGTESSTSVSFDLTGSRDYAICAVVYSGVDTTTPEDVTTLGNGAASTTITCTGVTPATSPTMLVVGLCRDYTNTAIATPTGMTSRSSAEGATQFAGTKVCELALSDTSATGNKTATSSGSGNSVGFTVLLRQASAGFDAATLPHTVAVIPPRRRTQMVAY